MDTSNLLAKVYELLTVYGMKVLAAIVIFIVGRWIAKGFRKLVRKVMDNRNVDPTIVGFVGNLTYIILLTFFVVAALGQIGIQTTSFIAILGAAGLAIGLALQGSLANFAADVGVKITISKCSLLFSQLGYWRRTKSWPSIVLLYSSFSNPASVVRKSSSPR